MYRITTVALSREHRCTGNRSVIGIIGIIGVIISKHNKDLYQL